jgi:hypothetical protein
MRLGSQSGNGNVKGSKVGTWRGIASASLLCTSFKACTHRQDLLLDALNGLVLANDVLLKKVKACDQLVDLAGMLVNGACNLDGRCCSSSEVPCAQSMTLKACTS